MTTGLTSTGFVAATTTAIQTAIAGNLTSTIESALDCSPDTPLGQINGIYASDMGNVWALLASIYQGFDPNSAQGAQLDVVGALRGIPRLPAFATLVTCTVNLAGGTAYAGATVTGLSPYQTVTANGALVANISGHPEYTFTNLTAIPSSASGNTTVTFICTQTGPVAVNGSSLTVITTPVGGWNSITNPNAGTLGSAIETDTAYRVRQAATLVPPGGGTFDSMRTTLLQVPGVISVQIYENDLNTTDANGLPPHSFLAVIWDGASPAASSNAIAQAIWNTKPAGILSYDNLSGTTGAAIDSTGATRTIGFCRATQVPIYLSLTPTTNSLWASGGTGKTALQQNALANFGNTLATGATVVAEALKAQCFTVAGVTDVPTFTLGTAPGPAGTSNITIAYASIATFATTNIVVTAS